MANEPVITVVGNLTADPELRTVGSGNQVADFTVASTPRTFNRQTNQWDNGEPLFLRCSAWREMASNVQASLTKGTRVIVTGRLTTRSYQANDGSTRQSLELRVDDIGPSLRFATARVTKGAPSGQSGYSGSRSGYSSGYSGGYSGGATGSRPSGAQSSGAQQGQPAGNQSGSADAWGSYQNFGGSDDGSPTSGSFGASGTDEPAF
jgi:single-strand DNA-binding protein